MSTPARQHGFTLLELLLSFLLLTVGLGLLVAILGGGLTQVRQSGDATGAALHAQSLLEQLGVMGPLEPGEHHGEFDGGRYRWELRIEQVEDPVPPPLPSLDQSPVERVGRRLGEPILYRVQLDVHWGEDDWARSLQFVTLRSRFPAPEAIGP
ncbi:prepilin-type N-terminal cleavage/methylation domain-containing protein [Arenimonas composti]|uniref:General secretion pathway protein GspI n=1 Tax=Arenimonas composti TR7-09 = DSM 18010 TaxID=1121013 RepID=A0A091BIH1_9GAMM|nr:prepilin-type N-terminal cleavage/methylation domain-containing protein [Arenimonas composti]KFN51327.1 hypothetical protein P873_03405 [Arenimonas composti TR7-09 = DSM 18010]